MTTGLVLAGHGSHLSPNTAGVVWGLVDRLRARGVADEVTAAFWKEAPSFRQVLDTLTADDITIVPVFTAQGYFTQTVISAEMGLDGALTRRDGRVLRYARTLSEHPHLAEIVRTRVADALALSGASRAETAVAIAGHGTPHNVESRAATQWQADALRRDGLAAEVVAVYLDDSPGIDDVYTLTGAPTLIVVPYFVALGSHTALDVPGRLGLAQGQQSAHLNGRAVYYTPPVGVDSSLDEIALELAREAGAPLSPECAGSPWDCFPVAGRDDLIEAVQSTGAMQFGEVLLTPHEARKFGDGQPGETLDNPAALRTWVREAPFRPLSTARGLPGGWLVAIDHPHKLHAVVETVYPGATVDWAANRRGTFQAAAFDTVIARQSGMFRRLTALNHEQQTALVADVCGGCVRHPTWHGGESPAHAIPCAEPCNLWMSTALERIE